MIFAEYLQISYIVNRTYPTFWLAMYYTITGPIQGLRPANERRRYKETPSLVGWAQT